jgi:hypothetical protein
MKSFFEKRLFFVVLKIATTGSTFLNQQKRKFEKKLEMDSGIGF